MISGTSLFFSLFNNLAIFIILVAVYGVLNRHYDKSSPLTRHILIGVSFGLFAAICMYAKIPVAEGVIVDQRNTVVALCGAYGGPLSAVVCALIAGTYRLYLGGSGALGGVIGVGLSALAGVVCYKFREKIDSIFKAALGALAATIIILPGFLFIGDLQSGWQLLKLMALPYGSAIFMGLFFVGLLLEHQERTHLAKIEIEKSERRYRESEERLDLALSGANEGIWDWDIQNKTVNFDSRYYMISGYSPNEFPSIFEEWEKRVHPDDIQRVKSSVAQYLSGDLKRYDVEFKFLRKDGSYMWIQGKGKVVARDKLGNPMRFIGTHSDISVRKNAEEALRIIRFSYDKAAIGIYRIGSDAKILDVNERAAQMLGYTKEELESMYIHDIDPHSNRQNWEPTWQSLQNKGRDNFETIHRRKDGIDIPVEITSNLLEYEGQKFSIAFVQDISERKEAEKEASRMGAALAEAQKMEAIGALAGGIAHDFNNILAGVIGYSELSLSIAEVDSPIHKNIQKIITAGLRARDLVQQILTFSRKDELEVGPMQAGPLVKEVLKLLRSTLPSSIQISQNISNKVGNILADPTQLHQIVMNLCMNAAQAMEENGGCLSIELSQVELSDQDIRLHPGLQPGEYLKLSVQDTGTGISKENLEKVFDPYFTTKEKGKGTGLGLATVHGIIKSYGGVIHVYSEQQIGTTFNVYIPTIVEQARAEKKVAPELAGGNEQILLVDDEPVLLDVGRQLLETLGYRVSTISDSELALETIRNSPRSIDLVLTDMTMPYMTGDKLAVELLKFVRIFQSSYVLATMLIYQTISCLNWGSGPWFQNLLSKLIWQK